MKNFNLKTKAPKTKTPKLPLTEAERKALRAHKLMIRDISNIDYKSLSTMLSVPEQRSKRLIALSEFQQIPSVGPRMAQCVLDLGYYSLNEMKDTNGVDLINSFEQLKGRWQDPCVEDVFRLVAHYAKHGDTGKQWWDFTEERKQYRADHGYPETRPTKAWDEKLD